jgi:hypothetical protein
MQLARDIESNLRPGKVWRLDVCKGEVRVYQVEIRFLLLPGRVWYPSVPLMTCAANLLVFRQARIANSRKVRDPR